MSRVSVVRGRDLEPVVSPRPDQVGLRLRRLLQAESGTSTFVIAETEIPAGRRHEMHRHPHAEQAIYVLRGSLTLVGPEAEPVILQAGDIAHVPAGQWHGNAQRIRAGRGNPDGLGGVSRAADAGYEEYDAGESP